MPRPVGVIRNIQVLRAIAALLVVCVHLDSFLVQIGLPIFGGGGVDIFFVISGFIMVYTTSERPVSSRSFMADRIARIVPIYWLITVAVFGIALLVPSLLQATRSDWGELFKSLAFIPFAKVNGIVEPVLFVGWTLNFEMFFYALFAVGLALPSRKWGIISVMICLGSLVGIGVIEQPESIIGHFYTSIIMLNFALGMLIGLYSQRLRPSAALATKLATVSIVGLGLIIAIVLPVWYPTTPTFWVSGLPASAVVAGAIALERWGWIIQNRWCLLLGNASYSIYLVHPFVTRTAQKIATHLPINYPTAIIMMISALICVCIVGVLTYRWLEQPLSRLARRRLNAQRLNIERLQMRPAHTGHQ
jgi:peptidoglycan/LPS O-acetylase OafA/YrhL